MLLSGETEAFQREFVRYCRNGQFSGIAGVRPDRIGNYRRLVFNIVNDALRRAYPITHALIGEGEWRRLIESFFAEWDLPSPQLWKMPRELCKYVEQAGISEASGRPYLADLLRFEWVEIEVFMMADRPSAPYRHAGDLLNEELVLNLEHMLTHFTYPVFKVKASESAAQKGSYFVVTYRHPQTLKAAYIEVAPVYARVIELLAEAPATGRAVLAQAAKELQLDEQTVIGSGPGFFAGILECGLLLGIKA